MDTIVIRTATSYQARDAVLAFINAGFKATKADIFYNISKGLPPIEQEDLYPLVLEGFFNNYPTTIKVYSVTAGYAGEGPTDLVSILQSAGFPLLYACILTDCWSHESKISITCWQNGKMKDNISGNIIFA